MISILTVDDDSSRALVEEAHRAGRVRGGHQADLGEGGGCPGPLEAPHGRRVGRLLILASHKTARVLLLPAKPDTALSTGPTRIMLRVTTSNSSSVVVTRTTSALLLNCKNVSH